MTRTSLVILLAAGMVASVGCSSKKYVRNETTPLINKTNELDDLTAKNTKDIKDVDARAQAGIQAVQAKAAEVDQKALAAGKTADDAQTTANAATKRVDTLTQTVVNLDNYRPVAETSVHFGFDKDNLTKKAKEALDQLATDVPNTKGYIVTVEGVATHKAHPVQQAMVANFGVVKLTKISAPEAFSLAICGSIDGSVTLSGAKAAIGILVPSPSFKPLRASLPKASS